MSRAARLLEQMEMAAGVKVSVNPSRLTRICSDLGIDFAEEGLTASELDLRLLLYPPTNSFYVWSAYHDTHISMAPKLGLDFDKCICFETVEKRAYDWAENLSPSNWELDDSSSSWYRLSKEFSNTNALVARVKELFH